MSARTLFTLLPCSVLFIGPLAKGSVVYQSLTYDTNTVTACPALDFNQDGTNDVTFRQGSVFCIDAWPGGLSCDSWLWLNGQGRTEVLAQDSSVVPLHAGDVVAANPLSGAWVSATPVAPSILGPRVWSSITNSGTVQGVGAPGSGDYMGVKFLIGSEWHHGWIRLGPIPNSASPLLASLQASVLAFAYETEPDTTLVIAPEPTGLFLKASRAVIFRLTAVSQDLSYSLVSQTNSYSATLTNTVMVFRSRATNDWLNSRVILGLLENSFNTSFPPGAKLVLGGTGRFSFLVVDPDKSSILLDASSVLSIACSASVHSGREKLVESGQGTDRRVWGKDIEKTTEYSTLTYDDAALRSRDGTLTRFQLSGILVQQRSTDLDTGGILDFITLRGTGAGTIRGKDNVILQGSLTGSVSGAF